MNKAVGTFETIEDWIKSSITQPQIQLCRDVAKDHFETREQQPLLLELLNRKCDKREEDLRNK